MGIIMKFQFHKVRLKAFDVFTYYPPSEEFQFHKVRLKEYDSC